MAPHRYHTNKWVTFAISIPVALSTGLTYTVSLWSEEAKSLYHLSQSQLSTLTACCNLGGYSSIISGLFYDHLERHHKAGPRLTLLVGAITHSAGYLGLWAVRNFNHHRGHVVGVMKASVGLSAALYTAVYSGLFAPDAAAYLLFLAIVPSLLAVAAFMLANVVPYTQDCELEQGQHHFTTEGRFLFALQTLATLAVFLTASQLAEAMQPHMQRRERVLFTAGAGLLLLPLTLIPWGSGGLHVYRARVQAVSQPPARGLSEQEQALLPFSQRRRVAVQLVVPDLGPRDCLHSANFWLLFFVCISCMGAGLGGLFGVCNAAARMVVGWLPEAALHSRGTPRPLFLVCTAALCTAVCLGLGTATRQSALYMLAPLSGVCFGSVWSLMPSLASDLFGLASFASNYTLLQLAPAVGSLGLAAKLASAIYQRALARHGAKGTTCLGADCFGPTYMILAALGCASTLAAAELHRRTRTLYTEVHGRLLRQQDEDLARAEPHRAGEEEEEEEDGVEGLLTLPGGPGAMQLHVEDGA
eukprot:scaffold20.g7685.t1